jgi:uncharacterized protein YabN with tetrapyrrole methylase and pyrophosphatase domain
MKQLHNTKHINIQNLYLKKRCAKQQQILVKTKQTPIWKYLSSLTYFEVYKLIYELQHHSDKLHNGYYQPQHGPLPEQPEDP